MRAVTRTSDAVADNVRLLRLARRWRQDELATTMSEFGHATWCRQTVSEIERHRRSVTVDELVTLAVIFRVDPSRLLYAG